MNKKKKHILLIRFSSMGDIVLQASVLNYLKYQFRENIKITILTSEGFQDIYRNHPFVDNIIAIKRGGGTFSAFALVKQIYREHQKDAIDLIFDLHGSLRSVFIKLFLPWIPRFSQDKRRLERLLLINGKINLFGKELSIFLPGRNSRWITQSERNITDLSFLMNEDWNEDIRVSVGEFLAMDSQVSLEHHSSILNTIGESFHDSSTLEEIFERVSIKRGQGRLIGLAPVGNYFHKRWPIERYIEFIQLCLADPKFKEDQFAIIAGPKDNYCEQFNQLCIDNPERVLNFTGLLSLSESFYLIKQCDLLVGNDTGFTHSAEALGVAALMIMGPTAEDIGLYPHLNQSETISKNIWCRPCSDNGSRKCFRKKHYCMEMITPKEVYERVAQKLQAIC
jgi:heptosyltransferase-2